jgi:hypothetical protein
MPAAHKDACDEPARVVLRLPRMAMSTPRTCLQHSASASQKLSKEVSGGRKGGVSECVGAQETARTTRTRDKSGWKCIKNTGNIPKGVQMGQNFNLGHPQCTPGAPVNYGDFTSPFAIYYPFSSHYATHLLHPCSSRATGMRCAPASVRRGTFIPWLLRRFPSAQRS